MHDPSALHVVPARSDRAGSKLLHGLLMFFVTGGAALFAGAKAFVSGSVPAPVPAAVACVLIGIALATLFFVVLLRVTRRRWIFQSIFWLSILAGTRLLAGTFLRPVVASVGSTAFVSLGILFYRAPLFANLSLAIAAAGIAARLGTFVSPRAALALLTVISFYDIVAVYGTKHMAGMFRGMAERGALFAFALTPLSWPALLARPVGDVPRAARLGAGDVVVPMMLAVAALRSGLPNALSALAGAMLGCIALFRLALRPRRGPMPALPPIALGASLAYLLSLIIFSSE